MDPITIGLLAGAGTGLFQGILDQNKENRDRAQNALIHRGSYWTGLRPTAQTDSNLLGSVVKGATTGLDLGQKYKMFDQQGSLMEKMGAYYDRGGMGSEPNTAGEGLRVKLAPGDTNFTPGFKADYTGLGERLAKETSKIQNYPSGAYDFSSDTDSFYGPSTWKDYKAQMAGSFNPWRSMQRK